MRSLLSLTDLTTETVERLTRRSVELAASSTYRQTLAGRSVGIFFRKSSTRTRTSFWAAATRLGAQVVTYGPDDLQLVTGESPEDTARVLSNYLDLLVARTNGELDELRRFTGAGLGVVNALTEHEHPTQALADLSTLREAFGELAGRELLYVGEGNSTAAALVLATALTPGFRLSLVTPEGYGISPDVFDAAKRLAGGDPGVEQRHDFDGLAGKVDAVYTSRWQTMGVAKADPDWVSAFLPYRVTGELLSEVGKPGVVFLHDLPAIRGQEVTDEVLDGSASLAWRQAAHKMTSAMSVLEWCAEVRW
ncbi:ornithine carbamoyltransferase [Amycolatopsis sp. CA-230715]|uniref:ornithine carbamoyltransferase n=1 Tax=Amycolatopsis sp. CA-230715 TaxID=2745196 RepID=UPI001C02F8F7|nr:ornithine carbamoyltransferase [Amycolatopsis sp. CA-230715]QWF84492.1 Ornithine carbamoyltransferase [Amycolatopsis sp. CA-230715]